MGNIGRRLRTVNQEELPTDCEAEAAKAAEEYWDRMKAKKDP